MNRLGEFWRASRFNKLLLFSGAVIIGICVCCACTSALGAINPTRSTATLRPAATSTIRSTATTTRTPTPSAEPTVTTTASATSAPVLIPATAVITAAPTIAATIAPTTIPPTPVPPTPAGERVRTGALCVDGTTSGATGSGACSSHGGVQCWYYSDGSCTKP